MSLLNVNELIELGDEILGRLESLDPKDGNIGEALQEFNEKANEFRRNKQWKDADALCRKSLQFACDSTWDVYRAINVDTSYARGTALMYLGTTYLSQGMLDGAIDCYEQSGDIFHNLSKPRSAGIAWMASGEVYELKADWDSAIKAYQLSLNAFGSNPTDQAIREFRSQVSKQLIKAVEKLGTTLETKGPSQETMMAKCIPVLGVIAAGKVLLINQDRGEEYIGIDDEHAGSPTFALRVQGHSMSKAGILDKDYVLIRKLDFALNGDIAAVRIAGIEDTATLKRFFWEGNHWRLQPENDDEKTIIVVPNPDHADTVKGYYEDKRVKIEIISDAEVAIEGKVVGVLRIM